MPNAKNRNDRKSPKSDRQTKSRNNSNFGVRPTKSEHWIYGHHTVLAALNNPLRNVRRVLITAQAEAKLCCQIETTLLEFVTKDEIEKLTGANAVHQGIAAEAKPLVKRSLVDIITSTEDKEHALLIILDQVTDPRNIGAILRSAAAFNADALIQQERNSPSANSSMAKAASGGLEHVDLIDVPNINRAIESLKTQGFWIIGLDSNAADLLNETELPKRCCLVLGAENSGLRRLTLKACDKTVRIPISSDIDSLNISNAAAVAMYEFSRQHMKGT